MPCEMGEKFPGPPMPQTYWEDGFRKAVEMFPMQPNERAELETLRSQIASLRALAAVWTTEAGNIAKASSHLAGKGPGWQTAAEVEGDRAKELQERAAAVTAIVGKE